jgi:beta-galactosidase
VHSNFERVELLLNDRSLGAQDMPRHRHLSWKVKYEPGTLEARGFKDGQVAQMARVETTSPPVALTLSADRTQIAADAEDVSVVTVAAVDDQRRRVPVAGNEVRFELRGPGRILGVGNGDPSCHEPDRFISQPRSRPLSDWKMHKVDSAENRPETAVDFDDTDWESVRVGSGQARGMPAHSFAVYRAAFELTEAEFSSGPLTLRIGQIDDFGWIYVNGVELARTTEWSRSYSFNLAEELHAGRNVIAIVVKNDGGPGGVGRGVVLIQPGLPAQWKRSLFNGLAQIIIQSRRQAGEITLTAAADGLVSASTTIVALPAAPRPTLP